MGADGKMSRIWQHCFIAEWLNLCHWRDLSIYSMLATMSVVVDNEWFARTECVCTWWIMPTTSTRWRLEKHIHTRIQYYTYNIYASAWFMWPPCRTAGVCTRARASMCGCFSIREPPINIYTHLFTRRRDHHQARITSSFASARRARYSERWRCRWRTAPKWPFRRRKPDAMPRSCWRAITSSTSTCTATRRIATTTTPGTSECNNGRDWPVSNNIVCACVVHARRVLACNMCIDLGRCCRIAIALELKTAPCVYRFFCFIFLLSLCCVPIFSPSLVGCAKCTRELFICERPSDFGMRARGRRLARKFECAFFLAAAVRCGVVSNFASQIESDRWRARRSVHLAWVWCLCCRVRRAGVRSFQRVMT